MASHHNVVIVISGLFFGSTIGGSHHLGAAMDMARGRGG
jgi:hypothetical protein